MSASPLDLSTVPAAASVREAARRTYARRLLEGFVLFELACQIALLSSTLGHFRFFFRLAAFASSLVLLGLLPGRTRRFHPALKSVIWVLAILCLELLNPQANAFLAALAQIAMYLAVLAPLFWVGRLRVELATLRRVLIILFLFHTASSAVGILQVYYPGRFQFAISTAILAQGDYINGLKYVNAFGQTVLRPMGLSDSPGSAATSGFYAALIGMLIFTTERRSILRALAVFGMLVGATVIYLSLVKATLIMLAVSAVAFLFLAGWRSQRVRRALRSKNRGRRLRVAALTAVAGAIAVVSFSWAVGVGGKVIAKSAGSLTSEAPGQVYYGERGHFLEDTVYRLLPEYPLGAGLGRWGMMIYYFGDPANTEHPPLWAEIQWTGWLLDGGVPLVLAYVISIGLAMLFALRLALNRRSGEIGYYAVLIFAYDLGMLACTFDYPFFMSQSGIDFWMLNGMLFAAALTMSQDAVAAATAPIRRIVAERVRWR